MPKTVRLPAEWEEQESLILVWPRDPITWPGRVQKVREIFVQIIRHVIRDQEVILLVHHDLISECRQRLQTAGVSNVRLVPIEHQDSWVRDYGPITVHTKEGRKHLKFEFDSWGGKYDLLLKDNEVVGQLIEGNHLPAEVEEIDFVLEGGAVETDGMGTFIATISVAEGRDQTPEEHEEMLRTHLGAKHVIWLEDGVEGDDTDGHIDTITRFVRPGVVVTVVAPKGHPDYDALQANLKILKESVDASGKKLKVIELPVPEPVTTEDGDPLPAGHANFLITNSCVLVPGYGGPSDDAAARILEEAIGRPSILIDHRDMIWGFGGIHCLSMQIAA